MGAGVGGGRGDGRETGLTPSAVPAHVRRVLGKHSGTFGAVGLAFGGFECLSETVRGKDDFWNGVVGGFAAGSVLAVRAGNPSAMLFTGEPPTLSSTTSISIARNPFPLPPISPSL